MNRDVQGRKRKEKQNIKFRGPEKWRSLPGSKNSKKTTAARKQWTRGRAAENEGGKVDRDQYVLEQIDR